MSTQVSSHATSQQSGAMPHTFSQQGVVKQPGVACGSSQRPPAPEGPHAAGGTSEAAFGAAPGSGPNAASCRASAQAGESPSVRASATNAATDSSARVRVADMPLKQLRRFG